MSLAEHYALWRAARARCQPLPERLPSGFTRWRDYDQYRRALTEQRRDWSLAGQYQLHQQIQQHLPGHLRAICAECDAVTVMDFEQPAEGETNWRESLRCRSCGLINRWRLAIHLFQLLDIEQRIGPIYLTEQLTPLYQAFLRRAPDTIGSEFLGDGCRGGETKLHLGVELRHEDVTALSMADNSIGAIGCFDVLEHVPDFVPALSEFHRVLEPGGTALISVPINLEAYANQVRAELEPDGSIRHLLEPHYHGDPVRAEEGVLCFHDFGWELVDQLKAAGFELAELWTVWAPEFGYLGAYQPFFIARKRGVPAKVAAHPAAVAARRRAAEEE